MAALHSPEPQGPQCLRAEELERPGGMTEKCEPKSTSSHRTAKEVNTVTPDHSFPNRESTGDGSSSQTGPLKSRAGDDDVAAKDNSVVDLTSDDEKALNTNISSNERNFDWSETEDETGNAHEFTKDNGNKASKDDEDKALEMKDISNAEETGKEKSLSDEEMSPVKGSCEELEGDEEEEDEGKGGEEKTVRQRKSRLICKECGKRFTRRETFNLHRHTHTHKDELVTLTCKECGLSFQHRSSLIKHRSEHREKEEQAINQQRETQLRYQCEYCRMTFSTLHKLKGHVCSSSSEKLSRWVRTSDSDKPFRCPLCRKEFYFKWCMTKHIQSHSMGVLFHCQECNKGFTDGVALRVHQRCHSALKPYECPDCGMVFKHHSVMEDHRRKHTQPTRLHQCRICSKTFKYSSLLHQHQYLHTGQKPFRCLECGRTFAFAQNLKAHCRQHKLRPHRPHACQICPLSFPDQDSLQAHVISHETVAGPGKENSNQRPEPKHIFNCPLCPEIFPTPADLRAHMLIHEAEYDRLEHGGWKNTYTCSHCPLTFSDETSLRAHLSTHDPPPFNDESARRDLKFRKAAPLNAGNVSGRWKGEDTSTRWRREDMSTKPLKCPDCGKSFRHRSVLELHMRIHSKTKPYQCKVCHKSFRFNNYLQQHVIIHTGEKPYKCTDCGKGFAFLQNMKTHQKLHQQKPFRCTQCRKGYSDETQLQRHIMSHTGEKPYKCDVCNKSFGIAYLLRDHMNTHTGERPHRCGECHKSFTWVSSLLVHRKMHAQKHQMQSQPHSYPKGIRIRSRGSRGRRGGRLSWPRLLPAAPMPQHLPPYQVPVSRDSEWETRTARPQSPQKTQMDLHFSDSDSEGRQQQEQWMPEEPPPPVQWQVEGGQLRPVAAPQHHRSAPQPMPSVSSPRSAPQQRPPQRSPGWTVAPSSSHPGPSLNQNIDLRPVRESVTTAFLAKPLCAPVLKSSSLRMSELGQVQQHWGALGCSTHVPVPQNFLDGPALWGVRSSPATSQSSTMKFIQEPQLPRWSNIPMSSQSSGVESSAHPKKVETRVWNLNAPQDLPQTLQQSEMPWNGREQQKPWSPGSVSISTSAQMGHNAVMSNSSTPSHVMGNSSLDLKETLAMQTKTLSSPEKPIINQELLQQQLASGWTNVSTSTHKVPITIQYEPRRFTHGAGTTLWGFQPTPVGPQTLLTGPIKPRNGQEMQQQPMMAGTQIIINQSSPFLPPPLAPFPSFALPGPHPLHSVAVGSLQRPPHPNIFFTPQAIMSERPQMPQAMPLPQLAPRTEPHKLGGRLPFAPDRLLQCMICGCSLPRELDLQMHYLQHAQGEI